MSAEPDGSTVDDVAARCPSCKRRGDAAMTVLAFDQADRPLVYECGSCRRRYNRSGELVGTPRSGHLPRPEGRPPGVVGFAITAARWRALQPRCTYCDEPIDGGPAGWYSVASDEETCALSPSGFHELDRCCA
jgi:hypothetical protein